MAVWLRGAVGLLAGIVGGLNAAVFFNDDILDRVDGDGHVHHGVVTKIIQALHRWKNRPPGERALCAFLRKVPVATWQISDSRNEDTAQPPVVRLSATLRQGVLVVITAVCPTAMSQVGQYHALECTVTIDEEIVFHETGDRAGKLYAVIVRIIRRHDAIAEASRRRTQRATERQHAHLHNSASKRIQRLLKDLR